MSGTAVYFPSDAKIPNEVRLVAADGQYNLITPLPGSILQSLEDQFVIGTRRLLSIAAAFKSQMKEGLANRPVSLKMLPSFIGKPTGLEEGAFLAVDFGGTNVRIMLVVLLGQGQYQITKKKSFPLKDPLGIYDFTAPDAAGTQMFDYIAEQIKDFTTCRQNYLLGHTFSFPSHHAGINEACLLYWTKEIRTQNVEGEDINRLLLEALQRNNVENVKPVAILNDTVATMLATSYSDKDCDLGSICGTGHNTCYLEKHTFGHESMIINIESGNFNQLPFLIYDELLDKMSVRPGEQRLEKMVGGYYLGEIVRLVVLDLVEKGFLLVGNNTGAQIHRAYSIKAEHVSAMLADQNPHLNDIDLWCRDYLGIDGSSPADRAVMKKISELVVNRAAGLVSATYIGILNHVDEQLASNHTVAVDGSVYEKIPGFSSTVSKILSEMTGENGQLIKLKTAQDASGIGAAVAAAMVQQTE